MYFHLLHRNYRKGAGKKLEMYCKGDRKENYKYYFSKISSSNCNAAFSIYLKK